MPSASPKLEFTEHAVQAMAERMIPVEWVERARVKPALRVSDPNDSEIEHFFCNVQERGDRVHSAAANPLLRPGDWSTYPCPMKEKF